MKIVRHPYQATIVPQALQEDALWHCVIRREGSPEVLAQLNAATKEDACCVANLEILKLKRTAGSAKPPLRTAS